MESKLVAIGNSRGIRLPHALIKRYHLNSPLIIEETPRGLLIRPKAISHKLSWKDTYRAMAKGKENWSDLDTAISDGVED